MIQTLIRVVSISTVVVVLFAATLGILRVLEIITQAEFREYGMKSILAVLVIASAAFAISAVLAFTRRS